MKEVVGGTVEGCEATEVGTSVSGGEVVDCENVEVIDESLNGNFDSKKLTCRKR